MPSDENRITFSRSYLPKLDFMHTAVFCALGKNKKKKKTSKKNKAKKDKKDNKEQAEGKELKQAVSKAKSVLLLLSHLGHRH